MEYNLLGGSCSNEFKGLFDDRFVRDDFLFFETARRSNDQLGFCVFDSFRQLLAFQCQISREK